MTIQSAIRSRTTRLLMLLATGLAYGDALPFQALRAEEPSKTKPTVQAFAQGKTCFVQTAQASVRCGPGSQFYATATLKLGATVDVFVETADGWSGIRPPEGSHNWIPASSVYLLPGGKSAEVAVEKTAAFIGSDSAEIDSLLFQTMLVQTQKVAVLGEASREEALWFRIAPPQGEFRWIKTSQLGTNPVQPPKQPQTIDQKSNNPIQLAGGSTPTETQEEAKKNDKDDAVKLANAAQVVTATRAPSNRSEFARRPSQPTIKSNRDEGIVDEVLVDEAIGGQEILEEELIDSFGDAPIDEDVDGDIVWSDEAEQVAKIEREIQLEQAQIAHQQGGTQQIIKKSGSKPPHAKHKQRMRNTAYEQDNKYWNTLHGPNGEPMKVGPVGGVLGWLGFSIVEDGPMQPTPATPPYRSAGAHRSTGAHQTAGGPLSRRGPYTPQSPLIENRLDRLPRPTRRYSDGSWWSLASAQGPLFGADSQTEPPTQGDTFSSEPDRSFENVPIAAANYRSQPPGEPRSINEAPDRFSTPAIQEALIQLTAMVAKPTEQWNLEPFRVSAKSWIELGDSPLVRGEARLLLDRIEEFESLRNRSAALQSPLATSSQASSSQTPPLRAAPAINAPPMTEAIPPRVAGSGSEASGWLVSVHTSLPGQPEFALTDDAGKVLAYVRPTTGLNLRRYVQQPVTVYGVPGYIPNLAARQIVAERVVRLR